MASPVSSNKITRRAGGAEGGRGDITPSPTHLGRHVKVTQINYVSRN